MPKVLLIEDDKSMLSLVSMFLEVEGYEVVQLNSGEDVHSVADILGEVKKAQPALILMDVHLHKMTGFDVLHGLRGDPELKDVRVLMSSGMDLTYECKREGANGFILKPYMPDELADKIQTTLGK